MKLAKDIQNLYDTINVSKWGPDMTVTGTRGGKRITIKRVKWYDKVFYKYRVESFGWSPAINIKILQQRINNIPRTPQSDDTA